MEENRRSMAPMVVTMVFSLGVGFLLGWYITGRTSAPMETEEMMAGEKMMNSDEIENGVVFPTEEKSSSAEGKNEVAVDNQAAGNSVMIARTVLQEKAWVAIHEEKNGAPGNILGARIFSAGTMPGVIELLRATMPGKIYYAMIHRDDDDGSFDIKKDAPMKNEAGQVIMVKFNTTGGIEMQ